MLDNNCSYTQVVQAGLCVCVTKRLVRENLLMTADTLNLLSCWDDRHVWISWNSDGSHVESGTGRFPERNAILRGDERNPFAISALAFQSLNTPNEDSNFYFSRLTIQRNSSNRHCRLFSYN